MTYHQQKGRGYCRVSVLKLVVMQRVMQVCQRQLRYF